MRDDEGQGRVGLASSSPISPPFVSSSRPARQAVPAFHPFSIQSLLSQPPAWCRQARRLRDVVERRPPPPSPFATRPSSSASSPPPLQVLYSSSCSARRRCMPYQRRHSAYKLEGCRSTAREQDEPERKRGSKRMRGESERIAEGRARGRVDGERARGEGGDEGRTKEGRDRAESDIGRVASARRLTRCLLFLRVDRVRARRDVLSACSSCMRPVMWCGSGSAPRWTDGGGRQRKRGTSEWGTDAHKPSVPHLVSMEWDHRWG